MISNRKMKLGGRDVEYKLRRYEGFREFSAHMEKVGDEGGLDNWAGRDAWAGATKVDFLKRCKIGNVELVPRSNEFMGKLEIPEINARKKVKVSAVVGSKLNVHQMYAGNPMCMTRKETVVNESSPVAIVIDVICSAIVSNDIVLRRGAAAMALARQISVTRPVDVWACYGGKPSEVNVAMAVKLPSKPIDLARTAFALSDVSYMRVGMHAGSADIEGVGHHSGSWFNDDMLSQVERFPHELGLALGYKAQDIVAVGGLAGSDVSKGKFSSDEKAVAWIEENVKGQSV